MDNIHINRMKLPKILISNNTRTLVSRRRPNSKILTSMLVLSVFTANVPLVLATIYVVKDTNNQTVKIMNDEPARFIPEQDAFYDIKGYVVNANPPNACTPVDPPPDVPYSVRWILLARRYDCDFQTKIENAQNASYYAIIVHNVGTNTTPTMSVKDGSKINIFAVFIGEYDGMLLRDNYQYQNGYHVRIQDDFSFNGYILPFAIVVGVCFVTMFLFLVWQQGIRWVRERRRNRKRRLPASALKKLPTQKWTKGDPYETCAICIDDFVINDKIRVLPCSHGFHTDCIDPWLTKGRRVCPICKRKVVLAEERFSESDSDSDSENAPLLGASTSRPSTQPPTSMSSSTFVQQRENPFRRAQNRMRERAQQRSVLIQNSDSSTTEEEEEEEYESSSDPSHSIVAEVHSSTNMSSCDHSCPQELTTTIITCPTNPILSSHHQMNVSSESSDPLIKKTEKIDQGLEQQASQQGPCKQSQPQPFDLSLTATTPDCNDNEKGNQQATSHDNVDDVVAVTSSKQLNISQELSGLPNPDSSSTAHHESSNNSMNLQTQHPKSNAIV